MLTLKANQKTIDITCKEVFIKGTIGTKCKIIFNKFWENYNKTIVFKNSDIHSTPYVIYSKDMETEVEIPHEVLSKVGNFKVGIYGTTDTKTLPTLWSDDIKIECGTDTVGEAPKPPSPNVYNELIELEKKAADIAQSVRDDADSGKFKGDPFTYEDFTAEQLAKLKGKDGIGISKTEINEDGELIITYSNDAIINLGKVVGTNGTNGYTPQKGVDYFTSKDIAELNIPTVDQVYSKTSENAQSGVAVEQAVAPKLDKPEIAPEVGKVLKVKSVNDDGTFTTEWADNSNDWVLVAKGEITEEVFGFIIDKDMNGNDFELSEFHLRTKLLSSNGNDSSALFRINKRNCTGVPKCLMSSSNYSNENTTHVISFDGKEMSTSEPSFTAGGIGTKKCWTNPFIAKSFNDLTQPITVNSVGIFRINSSNPHIAEGAYELWGRYAK